MSQFRLLYGNAADQLAKLPDNSISSVVTDPPYGLSKEPDPAEVLSKWLAGKDYAHGGGGFMGKSWDSFVPGPNLWREVFRVLKPGGHMLVFAGTRTQDLMGMSLRLAGFQIRDCLTWHTGTGFPKSHNISKAIDKLKPDWVEAETYRVTEWLAAARDAAGLTNDDIDAVFGKNGMAGHWCAARSNSQPQVPTADQWAALLDLLAVDEVPDKVRTACERVLAQKGLPGPAWFEREVVESATDRRGDGTTYGLGHSGEVREDRGATPAAEQWDGWGTALKPASEPILLVRKPLGEGTIARNVLEHGTGALNIDACRIGGEERVNAPAGNGKSAAPSVTTGASNGGTQGGFNHAPDATPTAATGRWPANVLLSHTEWCQQVGARTERVGGGAHASGGFVDGYEKGDGWAGGEVTTDVWDCADGCPVAQLDDQSGVSTSTKASGPKGKRPGSSNLGNVGGVTGDPRPNGDTYSDTGGASRFFYVAKPSKRERNYGCGARDETNNNHPTVKPVTLMRYLVRLITPPGGTVLDPFLGSGTTALAAAIEGFDCVGVELTGEYLPIIEARLDGWRRGDPSILTDEEQAALKADAPAPDPEPADGDEGPSQPSLDLAG